MAELEIVTSKQTNRTSIHTVHCVSAWYADNQKILNPYYVSVKERRNHVCEIGKEDCGGNDIATDVSNAENIKSDTSVCCDRGQLPLSLISVNNVQGENES